MSGEPSSPVKSAEPYLLGLEQFGMRFGLRRIRHLLELLDDPHEAYPTVHVVGTNGKSSTARMTSAAIRVQGIHCGAFTSPHLLSFRERIEIGGRPIGCNDFERIVRRVRAAVEIVNLGAAADDQVTQFEALTAAAYLALADAGVEAGVIEAGLGGRLDSTNVIDSAVQVLTGVSLDHTDLLGETVEQIAREKLDVVREGAVLVAGHLPTGARNAAQDVVVERRAKLVWADKTDAAFADVTVAFQAANATVALAGAEQFADRSLGGGFDRAAAIRSIRELIESGVLRGRMQVVREHPVVVFDAAHNPEAAAALVAALEALGVTHPLVFVVGMLHGKHAEQTLAEFVLVADRIICTAMSNPRSLAPTALAAFARGAACRVSGSSPTIEIAADPHIALRTARDAAGWDGHVVVTGSNYLLAELMSEPGAARSAI